MIFICILIIPYKVSAIEYQDVGRDKISYDFNNFYIENGYAVLNGWAATSMEQQLTGDDTHAYYLDLINSKTGEVKTYNGKIMPVDKTELMRYKTTYRVCGYNQYDQDRNYCYYLATQVGFEFRIPLSDLKVDSEYTMKFKMYLKLVNRGYRTDVYTPGVDKSHDIDGIRYKINSNISSTIITNSATTLMMRTGPGTNYSQQRGSYSCRDYGTRLYWRYGETYTNIYEIVKTNGNNIDSETWLRIGFREGLCEDSRSQALNGSSNSGWAAFTWFLTSGTPATIKTTRLNNSNINEIKTYTTEQNKDVTVKITLNNNVKQDLNIKLYHGSKLVYNGNKNFNGTQTFTFNYKIPDTNDLTVVITEPNGFETTRKTKIYISSNEKFNLSKSENQKIITVSTPVLVVLDSNNKISNYYEKIMLSANTDNSVITQGRGLTNVGVSIKYWFSTDDIRLNNDFNVYALFPSQDENLEYEKSDNYVQVPLEKTQINNESNVDLVSALLPTMYVSKEDGKIYNSIISNNLINTGYTWYPNWNDELGRYDYYVVGTKLGVNKIEIKVELDYTITNTMMGLSNGLYKIVRVKNPTNPNYIYSRTFSYSELQNFLGGN